MYNAGILLLDAGESEYGAVIRRQLRKGQPLTVAHYLAIIEDPSILAELGRYRERAERKLAALGDAINEAAPKEVAAYISDAAKGDEEAIGILSDWIKQRLPAEAATPYWIAVRLLLGIPQKARKFDVPRIWRALSNCRKSEEFQGWWRVERRGSKTFTVYQRPGMPRFDLCPASISGS